MSSKFSLLLTSITFSYDIQIGSFHKRKVQLNTHSTHCIILHSRLKQSKSPSQPYLQPEKDRGQRQKLAALMKSSPSWSHSTEPVSIPPGTLPPALSVSPALSLMVKLLALACTYKHVCFLSLTHTFGILLTTLLEKNLCHSLALLPCSVYLWVAFWNRQMSSLTHCATQSFKRTDMCKQGFEAATSVNWANKGAQISVMCW